MLKVFLFFNSIIFFINLYLIIQKKKIFKIKNVDFLTIKFTKYSYKNISDILNYKFGYKVKFLNNLNLNYSFDNKKEANNKKKNIRLFFIDYLYVSPYHKRQIKNIINILSKNFKIKICKNNPDYLFYNVFGCNHLKEKYNNAIKIALFSENQITDFNIADYSLGRSHINFLDRSFKMPYFFGMPKNFNNKELKILSELILKKKQMRKKFCSAVISNYRLSDRFRLKFINELSKYKRVDMGGRYKNNVGKIKNKIQFFKSYKFSIAMENTEGDGYISEKIIQSFLSGTIPIYYGDYIIDEFINPSSFILIKGKKDMINKIKYIKEIDNNDELYKKILKEKVFIDTKYKEKIEKEKEEFLFHIFSQDIKKAKRIDNYHWKI